MIILVKKLIQISYNHGKMIQNDDEEKKFQTFVYNNIF